MFSAFKNFSIFEKNNQKNPGTPKRDTQEATSSSLGRNQTSITTAFNRYYKEARKYNPLDYINHEKYFLGLNHETGQPIFLELKEVVHSAVIGPTRSGKGVFYGYKIVEAIRNRQGVVIFDVKEDNFLPQVCIEELERQNRMDDFVLINWPNDFGYKTFENDNPSEVAKKLTIMLNLIEVEAEAGASFYRKSERIALQKIVNLFYRSGELLEVEFKKDLLHLIQFLKYLTDDLSNFFAYAKEKNQNKPNFDLLKQYGRRYFKPELLDKCIDFKERDLPTLESLYFSFKEFENIKFNEDKSIEDAIFQGKLVYIKSDMLDEAALKFLKFVIADIVTKAKRKKGANCLILADEISFYPTQILSAALATSAGFGLKFFLAYQDDGQIGNENLKAAMKSNCQTKIYYKSSDVKTLEYIEKLSGKEIVTKVAKNGEEITIRQETEDYLNITTQRAFPKTQVAILLQESLPFPLLFDTQPIPVSREFSWEEINAKKVFIDILSLKREFQVLQENKRKSVDEDSELVEEFDI